MMKLSHEHLNILKNLARLSGQKGNLPNSAILLDKKGKVVAQSESLVATNTDATAHAERLVIEKYCQKKKSPLIPDVSLVAVLEPCLMCLSAAYWAGIKKIYYLLPASCYWDKIPWIAESKSVDKQKPVNRFSETITFKHLKEHKKEFLEIFDYYIKKVIPRNIGDRKDDEV